MATNTGLTTAITALSPVAYWKLTETSGTTVAQSGSSTAAALTLAGTYTLANRELISGDTTKFLELNGGYASTSSRGNITSYLLGQNTFSCLIELIAPVAQGFSASPTIFAYQDTGDTGPANAAINYYLSMVDGLLNYFHEYGTGSNQTDSFNCTLGNTYPTSTSTFKCHLIVTRSSNTYTVWVNGRKRATSTFTTAPTDASGSNLYIGTTADLRTSAHMTLGHMCIFNRVLTDSEIWDLNIASGYASGTMPVNTVTYDNRGYDELPTSFIYPVANKELSISTDPLIDLFVLRPELAYTVT